MIVQPTLVFTLRTSVHSPITQDVIMTLISGNPIRRSNSGYSDQRLEQDSHSVVYCIRYLAIVFSPTGMKYNHYKKIPVESQQ